MSKLDEMGSTYEIYNEIKAKDLQDEAVEYNDQEAVQYFFKTQKRGLIAAFILFLIFTLICCLPSIDMLISSSDIVSFLTDQNIIILLIQLSAVCLCIYTVRQYILIKKENFKSQYGVVKNKFCVEDTDIDNNTSFHYYLNVIFPNDTILTDVIIGYGNYKSLNVGDRVLVITYDNKSAYGICIKK